MDSIIEKARKVLALVEQGVDGEVQAAKSALEALLAKHGLTIEDLKNEKRELREFSIKSSKEILIFSHCILKMFGHGSFVWKHHYTCKRDYRHIYAKMTEIEFLDFKPFYEFHVRQFRKELKKMLETVRTAYIHKHDLFDPNPQKEEMGDKEPPVVDMQDVYRIMKVMEAMETSTYHKALGQ